jgi:hypothetical protein
MEELRKKLEELEAKINAFAEEHGYQRQEGGGDDKSELKEIAEILRSMKKKEQTITDKRFARKKRHFELTGQNYF